MYGDREPRDDAGAGAAAAIPAVRAARPADAPAVADIARRAATAVYEGTVEDRAIVENVHSDGYVAGLREHLRRVPDRDGYCYLVAEGNDGSVDESSGRERADSDPVDVRGFAQFVWAPMDTDPFVDRGECLLHSLYVDPGHWGGGLGTALVDAGIARLPDELTALRLAVLRGNDLGVSFYESYGFERTGGAEVAVAGATYDCHVYSLEL